MNNNTLRQCKAIIFDFGGTLDSDGEHWLDRFFELYEKTAIDLPRELIKKVFYQVDDACCTDPQVDRMGLRPLMKHHVHLQFEALELKDARKEAHMVDLFCAKTEYYLERNCQLLKRLRGPYKLGVVSNFYGNVSTICREAGLAECLAAILDSTQLGVGKPDPQIFRRALQEMGVVAEESIFVGDSYER
ncbi:MAG: HAD family hydrolase, partial [Desulforhabdus sp.]|nr:HAD family hydrolase [Desulforhabdus sp.]